MAVPNHIAFILDGNGRWAKKKGMPRTYGHSVGGKNVETIVRACGEMGVKYVTVYAFSTENWKRSDEEVNKIMEILSDYLTKCMDLSKKNNMSVKVIGDISALKSDMQDKIRELEEFSAGFDDLHFIVALNYGSRDEIRRAVRKMSYDVKDGKLLPEEISEDTISSYLDTAGIPDPDLMIRTSGEMRLSNYLMWQMAYSELYFTEVPWPEFNEEELKKAIEAYENRDRRYGGAK
ncbi:MAG: isoprenyl transferase [Lachnospiraceae bacterium]|nr:isoprenyl transferase [Lachnospiraceae bacterium]